MNGGRSATPRAGLLGRAALLGVSTAVLGVALAQPLLAGDSASQPISGLPIPGQYYRSRPVARLPAMAPTLPYLGVDVFNPGYSTAPPPAPSPVNAGAKAPEPPADMSLSEAIALAYRTNPTLQAGRYDLKATDQNLGLALSELRPTSEVQITGQYDRSAAGRLTQAKRFGATSSISTTNTLGAQLIVTQPILTGGKASADIAAANAEIRAGRAGLQATEGDLLLETITSYLDVRRDARALAIRQADLGQLRATLEEVHARRTAGELTRTDIAQTETQIQNAETAYNLTRAQLEQSRASFASLVGLDPGNLAPEPPLPQLPTSIDEAFDQADQLNPELAQARYTEAASREKIAAARAAAHPTFALQGTAGISGPAEPFHLRNDDQAYVVQGVLTIPLTSGGHTGAAVAQAEDTNSGDRLRIEAARRRMVLDIANAWNQMVTMRRNLQIDQQEVESSQTFYAGSFAEYRAGLRSTFDVLYAQETLLNAEIALIAARHDLYVAQATLLRHIGVLDVSSLTSGVGLYDPTADLRLVEQRSATPWDALPRGLDHLAKPGTRGPAIQQPPVLPEAPALAPPNAPPPPDAYISYSVVLPDLTSSPLPPSPRPPAPPPPSPLGVVISYSAVVPDLAAAPPGIAISYGPVVPRAAPPRPEMPLRPDMKVLR